MIIYWVWIFFCIKTSSYLIEIMSYQINNVCLRIGKAELLNKNTVKLYYSEVLGINGCTSLYP